MNGPGIRGLHIEITLPQNKKLNQKEFQNPTLDNLFSKLKMVKLFCTVRDEMSMPPCSYGFINQILLNP